jgi:hypothetical protein
VVISLVLKTFNTIVEIVVNLKNIVQLQQFKKFHYFFTDITDFKMPEIDIGCFHDRKENAKSGAIYKINTLEIQYQSGVRFVK